MHQDIKIHERNNQPKPIKFSYHVKFERNEAELDLLYIQWGVKRD